VKGKRIGILGISFKPKTDDIRDAPSLVIVPMLQEAGASIAAHDPVAMEHAKKALTNIDWKDDAYAVAEGADVLVLITEWNEFRALDMDRVGKSMKQKLLVDLRNVYKPEDMDAIGFD